LPELKERGPCPWYFLLPSRQRRIVALIQFVPNLLKETIYALHFDQFVSGDRRCPAAVEAIGPGRRPIQFGPDESRRMNPNYNVVYRCLWFRALRQLHSGTSGSFVRHNDRLHDGSSLVIGAYLSQSSTR
jgi:hypothetical protein